MVTLSSIASPVVWSTLTVISLKIFQRYAPPDATAPFFKVTDVGYDPFVCSVVKFSFKQDLDALIDLGT